MTELDQGSATRRSPALDGMRGIAIILVVLSHGWTLWPTEGLHAVPGVEGLFRSGNLAVTVFFVIGGFLLTRSLLGEVERTGRVDVGIAWLRRFARLSAHVYPLLIAMLVVHSLDESDIYGISELRASVASVATYTWNWYVQDNALSARPDLGHLWYVSVYLQVATLLIILVAILRRRRGVLFGVLGLTLIATFFWRSYTWDYDGEFIALLRTTTRWDGMICGAMLALAAPWMTRVNVTVARFLPLASVLTLTALTLTTGWDRSYFSWAGFLMDVGAVAFIIGTLHPGVSSRTVAALSWRPLVALGGASMAVYVWHYPMFWAVARHTHGWLWPTRTVVALTLTAAVVVLVQRLVERPLQRWLAHPKWAHARMRRTAASPVDGDE